MKKQIFLIISFVLIFSFSLVSVAKAQAMEKNADIYNKELITTIHWGDGVTEIKKDIWNWDTSIQGGKYPRIEKIFIKDFAVDQNNNIYILESIDTLIKIDTEKNIIKIQIQNYGIPLSIVIDSNNYLYILKSVNFDTIINTSWGGTTYKLFLEKYNSNIEMIYRKEINPEYNKWAGYEFYNLNILDNDKIYCGNIYIGRTNMAININEQKKEDWNTVFDLKFFKNSMTILEEIANKLFIYSPITKRNEKVVMAESYTDIEKNIYILLDTITDIEEGEIYNPTVEIRKFDRNGNFLTKIELEQDNRLFISRQKKDIKVTNDGNIYQLIESSTGLQIYKWKK